MPRHIGPLVDSPLFVHDPYDNNGILAANSLFITISEWHTIASNCVLGGGRGRYGRVMALVRGRLRESIDQDSIVAATKDEEIMERLTTRCPQLTPALIPL